MYPSMPSLPIRLTAAADVDDMDGQVFVLNVIQYAPITLADVVLFLPGQLLVAVSSRILLLEGLCSRHLRRPGLRSSAPLPGPGFPPRAAAPPPGQARDLSSGRPGRLGRPGFSSARLRLAS